MTSEQTMRLAVFEAARSGCDCAQCEDSRQYLFEVGLGRLLRESPADAESRLLRVWFDEGQEVRV